MNVLIADKFEAQGVAALRECGCTVTQDAALKDDALIKALSESSADVLVVRSTKVSAAALEASANLKVVIRAGSGYDTIDVASATKRQIHVCNCPGMNSVAVAELTMGLMIALDRRIVDETSDLRLGVWNKKKYSKALGLKGRTLGIVGLGKIGYELAKRAAAFEMNLVYADVVDHTNLEKELGIKKLAVDDLLAASDFISLHVPGGKGTKHFIGERELSLMKPTAFVLNCSRGGVIDEKALVAAIDKGAVGGAALDVFEIEPGANDTEFADPVIKASRVYGTHHVGASTQQAQNAVADEVVRIVKQYMESGTALNCVNPFEKVSST